MPPRLTRALAFVSLSLFAAAPASAQGTVSDSLRAAIPSIEAARVAASPSPGSEPGESNSVARRSDHLQIVFYSALAGAAGIAAVLHVDPDSGGYDDGWTTATDFPDKAVHALAAWA